MHSTEVSVVLPALSWDPLSQPQGTTVFLPRSLPQGALLPQSAKTELCDPTVGVAPPMLVTLG